MIFKPYSTSGTGCAGSLFGCDGRAPAESWRVLLVNQGREAVQP